MHRAVPDIRPAAGTDPASTRTGAEAPRRVAVPPGFLRGTGTAHQRRARCGRDLPRGRDGRGERAAILWKPRVGDARARGGTRGEVGLSIVAERAVVGERHSGRRHLHDGFGDRDVMLLPIV